MKTNAIVRIIIYSLVLLLLTGILLGGLEIGSFVFEFSDGNTYTSGDGSADAAAIRNLDIEWASGAVTIETADVDAIIFRETGGTEQNQMAYAVSGDTLILRYQKPAFRLGFQSVSAKALTVQVPKDWTCQQLEVDVASAGVNIRSMSAKTVRADCASGTIKFIQCSVSELEIDTASGDIQYSGTLNTLELDGASADFIGVFQNVPDSMDMDTASGDLDITLPADCGYQVDLDAASGDFYSDFGGHSYGDGHCKIEVDTASGDLTIRKGE